MWARRITRDSALFGTATGLLIWEVLAGGGRPSVLTALVGLLLSPVMLRIDERIRRTQSGKNGSNGNA